MKKTQNFFVSTLGTQTLKAYLQRNGRTFGHYAYLQTGDKASAKAILRSFSAELGLHWDHTLQQADYDAYAWRLLKRHVEEWLERHGREPRQVEKTACAYAKAVDRLRAVKRHLGNEESDLGLYQALSRLSESQFDVMILRYLLGQKAEDIAAYMGISRGTVDSTVHSAKEALMRSASVRSLLKPEYRPVPSARPGTSPTAHSGDE